MIPHVTLDVLNAVDHDGEVTITTKVDGNFDRAGIPDRVIIDHHLILDRERIVRLTCRLAQEEQTT